MRETQVNVKLDDGEVGRIDKWRIRQKGIPTRPEAVRRILASALAPKSPDFEYMIRPLTEDEGGGWLCYAPRYPGCMSDGATPEEALARCKDAMAEWIDEDGERSSKK